MKQQILTIEFGEDQEIGLDKLIEEMKEEGKIIASEKTNIQGGNVAYSIEFNTPYDTYLFGHGTADLFKYLTKR